jgi:hypothetical protein
VRLWPYVPFLLPLPHMPVSYHHVTDGIQNLYNVEYRKGKSSQYTYENVCIVPGGRSGLARIASVVVSIRVTRKQPEPHSPLVIGRCVLR